MRIGYLAAGDSEEMATLQAKSATPIIAMRVEVILPLNVLELLTCSSRLTVLAWMRQGDTNLILLYSLSHNSNHNLHEWSGSITQHDR